VSTVLTDALGRASTVLTPGRTAGDHVVEASVMGRTATRITVTGRADRTSARLLEVSGNNQPFTPGTELPAPLVVRLADQFDNPLVGEMVQARVRSGAATFVSTTAAAADGFTDAHGQVEFTVRLGAEALGVLIEMTALEAPPVQFLVATVGIAPFGNGIAIQDDGSLLVLYALTHQLVRFLPGSDHYTVVETTLSVNIPAEIVRDSTDTVLVGDEFPAALQRVDTTTGSHTTLSGCARVDLSFVCTRVVGGGPPLRATAALAREAGGTILVGDRRPFDGTSPPRVLRVHPQTGDRELVSGCRSLACTAPAGTGPALEAPEALAVEASGGILVGDTETHALLRIDPHNGNRTILSGCANASCSRSVGAGPPLERPQALAVEAQGTIIVAEAGFATRALLRVDPQNGDRTVVSGCANTTCSTLQGTGPPFSGDFPDAIAITADGAIVAVDRGLGAGAVLRVDPTRGTRTVLFLLRP
jgi:hypothetical protein